MESSNLTLLSFEKDKPEAWETWGIGLVIVTFTAFSAPVGILLVPLCSKRHYDQVMSLLVALGIGALSGSIMFIMIPQAFKAEGLYNGNYLRKSAIILGALYSFFMIDRVMQYFMEWRRMVKAQPIHRSTLNYLTGHDNKACDSVQPSAIPIIVEPCEDLTPPSMPSTPRKNSPMTLLEPYDPTVIDEMEHITVGMEVSDISNALVRRLSSRRAVPVIQQMRSRTASMRSRCSSIATITPISKRSREENGGVDETIDVSVAIVDERVLDQERVDIATVAYMIIFGSAANNFVDGMSNGVAFGDSLIRGLSVGLACVAQQFPQELGLLAVLVQSGLGMRRALLLNLIPASLSYLGFFVGVKLDSVMENADNYVFAISAGMYLYVFLGTLIPEVRESTNALIKTNIRESLVATALQTIGISFGVTFMFAMAKFGQRMRAS